MRAQIKKWREQRAKLVGEAREHFAVMNDTDKPEADRTAAQAKWDKAMSDADSLFAKITNSERMLDAEEEQEGRLAARADQRGVSADQLNTEDQAYADAWRVWLAQGPAGLTTEQNELIRAHRENLPKGAQTTTPGTGGGVTVPETTQAAVERALKQFGSVRRAATVLTMTSGEALILPTNDDTANKGARIGENVAVAEQDTVFGNKQLDAYIYTSKLIRIPIPLIQDSSVDIEGYIGSLLGERIGRIEEEEFTSGDGASKPNGIVTASLFGNTAAAAAAIAYVDLIELEHSVNPAYRQGSKYMLGDTALKVLKKLVDGEGRPLWVPGVATKEPDTINGYPYEINVEMAAPASAAKSMLFGRLDKYLIRDVGNVIMMILRERFAEYFQIGMVGFHRTDGELLDAGQGPVRHMVHP